MMPPIHRKLRVTVLAAVACALMAPTVANAAENQLSIMMDDDLLVYRDDFTRDAAMRKMKEIGVDAVRVTVLWSVVTNHIEDTTRYQKRFKKYGENNPRAYPPANWDRYDRLARACRTLKIICYFDVTGPGPSWTHAKPPAKYAKDAKWWKPNPRHFYKFVQAAGKRFSGSYKDENDGRPTIPRVAMWSLWNEPNQGGWLRPQYINDKPISPSIYRKLFLFGQRALVSTGHGGDVILAGETAPTGVARKTTTSAMDPKTFISEVLCGAGTTQRGCASDFAKGPIQATAWAHHPYTKKNAPTVADTSPGAITMANFGDLGTLLDQLSSEGAHIAPNLPLMSTEFGYETNPPDPFAATTPDQQALYLEQGDYLAWRDPRVLAQTQFLLKDVPPNKRRTPNTRGYWGTYQSGILTAGGTPKPAAQAYSLPFLAFVSARSPENLPATVTFWGQIRFRDNVLGPSAPDSVQLQFKPVDGSADWANYGDPVPVTSQYGYFSGDVAAPGTGYLRVLWSGAQNPFTNVESLPQLVQ
jgi:hypothetical protein